MRVKAAVRDFETETNYERNGGRTLSFYLEQEDLLLAKKIDKLKLKW